MEDIHDGVTPVVGLENAEGEADAAEELPFLSRPGALVLA